LLTGLPLFGAVLEGLDIQAYLEFPPKTRYISHSSFSWGAFLIYSCLIGAAVLPFILRGLQLRATLRSKHTVRYPFPWWGWLGCTLGVISWVLAWSRFSWFEALQPHTFFPLWFSYILIINALTYRRTGRCMIVDRPGFFVALFPVSAAFWWLFEYLNRFVQNWYYVGVEFRPLAYFCYATLSFSTVLPAVLGTREWIHSRFSLESRFGGFKIPNWPHPRLFALLVLAASCAGLTGVGIWPNILFPLLWLSPLLIIVAMKSLLGEKHLFSNILQGDWTLIVSSALAALFCGFLWEMWNYYSLAQWKYSIPYVHSFKVFEMPLLGYAGYLPFGLQCAVAADFLSNSARSSRSFDSGSRWRAKAE
jgi:hypothetical protein